MAEPSEEITIPASRVPPLVALALGPFTALLSCGGFVVWWVTGLGPPVATIVGCAGGAVLGLGVAGWAVRQLLLAPSLVLVPDALRVCRRGGQVTMHIPYRNIAAVNYLKAQEGSRSAH